MHRNLTNVFILFTGLGDHGTGVTTNPSSFPNLTEHSGSLTLKTDPLLVSRYNNAMAAVAANPELRLTDRLTELRQGLSSASQQPNTSVSLLPGAGGTPPYLSVSHGSYGLLSSHPYYSSSGCPGTGVGGMYLNPPVVPPSLLYPQLYNSVAHNQLHPSIHLIGSNNSPDLLRSPDSLRNEEELQTNSNHGSRGSSTGSVASVNGGTTSSVNNIMIHVEQSPSESESPALQIPTTCTTTSNGTEMFGTPTNGHTDTALWRPY